jgi:hypothetical protein
MNNRPVETAVLRRQSHPIIINLPISAVRILNEENNTQKIKAEGTRHLVNEDESLLGYSAV